MRDGDKKGRANQPTERAGQITEHTQPKDSLQTGKGTKRGLDKQKTAKEGRPKFQKTSGIGWGQGRYQ